MINCQRCNSKRVAGVQSHGKDCQNIYIGSKEHQGYLPDDFGIGGGDDLYIDLCLNCGQVQGQWPLPITELEEQDDEEE